MDGHHEKLDSGNSPNYQLASSVAGTIGRYMREREKPKGQTYENSVLEDDVIRLSSWFERVAEGTVNGKDVENLRYAIWPKSSNRKNDYDSLKEQAAAIARDLRRYKSEEFDLSRRKQLLEICLLLDTLEHPISGTD